MIENCAIPGRVEAFRATRANDTRIDKEWVSKIYQE